MTARRPQEGTECTAEGDAVADGVLDCVSVFNSKQDLSRGLVTHAKEQSVVVLLKVSAAGSRPPPHQMSPFMRSYITLPVVPAEGSIRGTNALCSARFGPAGAE
ncbi:unnamed protein product [Boreogadus saida]